MKFFFTLTFPRPCAPPCMAPAGIQVLLHLAGWFCWALTHGWKPLSSLFFFFSSHHSLIPSPSGSCPLCTPHALAPTTREGKDGSDSSASFDLHPKHSMDTSKTPFPLPNSCLEKNHPAECARESSAWAPRCVGMDKKKENQGFMILERELKETCKER